MANLAPSGEALFRTLIAAKNAPFSVSLRPPSHGPDFYPKIQTTHSCDYVAKKGVILETHGFPGIFLKFRKILGNLSPSGEALFGTLIAAKNSPFSASFRRSAAALIFTQNLDNSQLRLDRKMGHFGDTWIARHFRKISEKSRTI